MIKYKYLIINNNPLLSKLDIKKINKTSVNHKHLQNIKTLDSLHSKKKRKKKTLYTYNKLIEFNIL